MIIFLLLSLLVNYIIFFAWDNYELLKNFLNSFYTYEDIIFLIKHNIKTFISWLLIYLLFLAFIREKKWAISNTNWSNFKGTETMYNKYAHIVSFIHIMLSFLFPVYTFYLFTNGYTIDGILVILISVLLLPSATFLSAHYYKIINNYEALIIINKARQDNKTDKIKWTAFFFQLINNIIASTFLFSFIFILIWYLYNLHLISILYIHIAFIFIYIIFNIIENRFPQLATICVKWVEKKWILLEHTPNKIILLQKTNRYIYSTNEVEYIKIKNIK